MTPPLTLYDTTLRDGTQGTGISFSVTDKLRIAEKLDDFGVHYIEGGFPGSNPKDAEFFLEARRLKWRHAKITAFGATRRGRLRVEDDPQIQTLLDAATPAVCIVGKTAPIHVTEIFHVPLEENLAMIAETIAFLKKEGREVIYDAEHFFDAYRDDRPYALQTLFAARDAGADLLVLCDTNGGSLPTFIGDATQAVSSALGIAVGIHTHDDCGLGVANALAGVAAGASQVQGTINGYGERVGNCNLITVVANLQLKLGLKIVPDLTKLRDLSLFVDELANAPQNIRAPYIGSAAFTHKGGQHVHAVQKFASSYEHIEPTTVGNRRVTVVSDLSGQSNILVKAQELGFDLEKGTPQVQQILQRVKELESQGYEFEAAEASFDLLIRKTLGAHQPLFDLIQYHCSYRHTRGGEPDNCEATVRLAVEHVEEYTVALGDGPVNALDGALRKALRRFYPEISAMKLADYKVRILSGQRGTAARTRVLIESSDGHLRWGTVGVSDNIIEASWLALVDSIEYFLGRSL